MKALFLADAPSLTRQERILYLLVAGFFLTLYMGPFLNNLFIGALFLHTFFVFSTRDRLRTLAARKDLLLVILFYLYNVVSGLMSKDFSEGLGMIQLRVPLLLFPLSVGTWTLKETERDRMLLCFAAVHTLGALACLGGALVQCKVHGWDTQYLYDDALSDLANIQSVYFALMTEIAVFSFIYLLQKGAIKKPVWAYVCLAFLLMFHFMLASRIGLILMYSGLLLFAGWRFFIQTRKWRQGLALVGFLVLCMGAFVCFFPKTLNRFRELEYTNYHYDNHGVESHYNMKVTPDQWNGANIRLAIWKCAWTVSKAHLWTGVPLGDKREVLVQQYRDVHFDFAVQSRRDAHNTYLDVLVTFGIPGLLLFLAAFGVLPLARLARHKEYLGIAVVLVFLISMVTETYIDRSLGCILLGFFVSFF